MKKVILSVVFGIFALMLAGCPSDTGSAPITLVEVPATMTWEYAIGDKVLHKSGVLGVVIDMDFATLTGISFGNYARGEGQWDGKQMQCYRIRLSGKNGLTTDWISVLELEDAPDG